MVNVTYEKPGKWKITANDLKTITLSISDGCEGNGLTLSAWEARDLASYLLEVAKRVN